MRIYIAILIIYMPLYIVATLINISYVEDIIKLMTTNIKYNIEIDKYFYNKILLGTKVIIILGGFLGIFSIVLVLVPVIPICYYIFFIRKLEYFNKLYENILENHNNE